MRPLTLLACAAAAVLLASCTLMQQIEEGQAFSQCKFRLKSVANTYLAGVRIQGKREPGDLGSVNAYRVTEALVRKQVPLSFTLNLEVENPNPKKAAMNRLEFTLLFDDLQLLELTLERRVEIPAKSTVIVPLDLSVDLAKAMSGKGVKAITNLAFNIAGEGDRPTRLSMRALPFIDVGGVQLPVPVPPLAVTFEITPEQGKALRKKAEAELEKKK